jgi:hypothetical protein
MLSALLIESFVEIVAYRLQVVKLRDHARLSVAVKGSLDSFEPSINFFTVTAKERHRYHHPPFADVCKPKPPSSVAVLIEWH